MAYNDLALTTNGDLYIGPGGDFELIDSIRQAIQIKLQWIRSEWCFNESLGTPYIESVFVKNPNRAVIEKALRDQILSVDGVTGITSLDLSWDKLSRVMYCTFSATTTEGEIESEVTLRDG